jgi:multidrug efflux pump subunit AcrB
VLGAVLSIVVTLLGLFAIKLLPIARYPQITPPAVRIAANYPGASSEDAAQAVAAPIEEQLAGLQGMLYYASSNSSDGSTNITVTFDVTRNQDLAAVDVQNAVKLAEPQLPDACGRTASRSSRQTPTSSPSWQSSRATHATMPRIWRTT